MAENNVSAGIGKLRRAIGVRAVGRAAVAGIRIPVGNTLDTLLPTAICITLVSLLDEFLEEFIDSKYPGTVHKNLGTRIRFLTAQNELTDARGLDMIRGKRNAFAHDSDVYASWDDVDQLFRIVEGELRHLGAIPG